VNSSPTIHTRRAGAPLSARTGAAGALGALTLGLALFVGCSAAPPDPAPGPRPAAPGSSAAPIEVPPELPPSTPLDATAADAGDADATVTDATVTDATVTDAGDADAGDADAADASPPSDGAVPRPCGVGAPTLCALRQPCLEDADCGTPGATCRVGLCSPLCLPGNYTAGSTCGACPVGTYSDTSGAAACTPCGPGMTTAATGSASAAACTPLTCAAGTYVSVATCVACPRGTYSTAVNSAACAACPDNTSTPAAGSTSCDACPADQTSNAASNHLCVHPPPFFSAKIVRTSVVDGIVTHASHGGWTATVSKGPLIGGYTVIGTKGGDRIDIQWAGPDGSVTTPRVTYAKTGVYTWTGNTSGFGTVQSWDPATRVLHASVTSVPLRRTNGFALPGNTVLETAVFSFVLPP